MTDELESSTASSGGGCDSLDGTENGTVEETEEALRHRMRFEEMLRRSQEEDLQSIEDTNCIYR